VKEGRKRMVRRMCSAIGHPVQRLVRTRIGQLTDRTLAPGEWRALSVGEVRSLYEAATSALAGLDAAEPSEGLEPGPG
jgi:23S rRNA pseudouridine2605 synthase